MSAQTGQRAMARCRWCEWSTPIWSGKRRATGWRRLRDHVVDDHPEQHAAILSWLDRTTAPEVRA